MTRPMPPEAPVTRATRGRVGPPIVALAGERLLWEVLLGAVSVIWMLLRVCAHELVVMCTLDPLKHI